MDEVENKTVIEQIGKDVSQPVSLNHKNIKTATKMISKERTVNDKESKSVKVEGKKLL